jgi:hypothetical protein
LTITIIQTKSIQQLKTIVAYYGDLNNTEKAHAINRSLPTEYLNTLIYPVHQTCKGGSDEQAKITRTGQAVHKTKALQSPHGTDLYLLDQELHPISQITSSG